MSSQEPDAAAGPEGRAGTPRWLYVLAAVVLVAGLAILAVTGTRAWQERRAAEERDAVTDVASQVIINAFSFDHRTVDESLQQLRDVSTGDFFAEQEQWSAEVRDRVVQQKAVTTATVAHAAVESLDRDAGEASVLVVFTAHSEREGQEPITGRQAMHVDLVREDDTWKATAVDQVGVTVPVGESSSSVGELDQRDPAGRETTGSRASGKDPAATTSTPAPSRGGR